MLNKGGEKMNMDALLALLRSITSDTSIEEARRIIAEAVEGSQTIIDDLNALRITTNDLQSKLDESTAEIARLKEENGRLYRDRINRHFDDIDDKVTEKENDIEKQIAELEANIKL